MKTFLKILLDIVMILIVVGIVAAVVVGGIKIWEIVFPAIGK